ncbi:MAG: hypothetical protein ACREV4_13790 [Gammaproteobacteria bacterium]
MSPQLGSHRVSGVFAIDIDTVLARIEETLPVRSFDLAGRYAVLNAARLPPVSTSMKPLNPGFGLSGANRVVSSIATTTGIFRHQTHFLPPWYLSCLSCWVPNQAR